jgi:hypothetical protein
MITKTILLIILGILFVVSTISPSDYFRSNLYNMMRGAIGMLFFAFLFTLAVEHINSVFFSNLVLIIFILIAIVYYSITQLQEKFLSNKIALKYFIKKLIPAITSIQKINKTNTLNKLKEDGIEYKEKSIKYAKENAKEMANKLQKKVERGLVKYVQNGKVSIDLTNEFYGVDTHNVYALRVKAKEKNDITIIAFVHMYTQALSPSNCRCVFDESYYSKILRKLGFFKYLSINFSLRKDIKSVSENIKNICVQILQA